MKVLQPVTVTDAMLVGSSVGETDYGTWSAATTYAAGDRVIKTVTHRIYESGSAGNIGHNPTDPDDTHWIDIGPTNRWAMFDQALGSSTTKANSIVVRLAPGAVDAVAVLEVVAATVRVQAIVGEVTVYDQTRAVTGASLVFDHLPVDPAVEIYVTAAGTGTVSVGTVLVGTMLDLGVTEASPTIGITDFSKRTTDDFGVTTVTERTWAKNMSLRSKIDSDDVDMIQRRLVALRAKPALWVGEDGYDSLTVYGFFKTFSIDLALETISYCSFSIEGLGA